jgi:hypothetical protein
MYFLITRSKILIIEELEDINKNEVFYPALRKFRLFQNVLFRQLDAITFQLYIFT